MIYAIAAEILGPHKILFGSDFPLLKPGRYFREMREAGVPPEAMKKICGENAASLLNLLSPAPFGRSSPQSSLK